MDKLLNAAVKQHDDGGYTHQMQHQHAQQHHQHAQQYHSQQQMHMPLGYGQQHHTQQQSQYYNNSMNHMPPNNVSNYPPHYMNMLMNGMMPSQPTAQSQHTQQQVYHQMQQIPQYQQGHQMQSQMGHHQMNQQQYGSIMLPSGNPNYQYSQQQGNAMRGQSMQQMEMMNSPQHYQQQLAQTPPQPKGTIIGKGKNRVIRCDHDGCGKEFKSPGGLSYHLKKGHLMPSKAKQHRCPYEGCQKAFSSKGGLKYHLANHDSSRIVYCPQAGCTRSFKTNNSLRYHLKKDHHVLFPTLSAHQGIEGSALAARDMAGHEGEEGDEEEEEEEIEEDEEDMEENLEDASSVLLNQAPGADPSSWMQSHGSLPQFPVSSSQGGFHPSGPIGPSHAVSWGNPPPASYPPTTVQLALPLPTAPISTTSSPFGGQVFRVPPVGSTQIEGPNQGPAVPPLTSYPADGPSQFLESTPEEDSVTHLEQPVEQVTSPRPNPGDLLPIANEEDGQPGNEEGGNMESEREVEQVPLEAGSVSEANPLEGSNSDAPTVDSSSRIEADVPSTHPPLSESKEDRTTEDLPATTSDSSEPVIAAPIEQAPPRFSTPPPSFPPFQTPPRGDHSEYVPVAQPQLTSESASSLPFPFSQPHVPENNTQVPQYGEEQGAEDEGEEEEDNLAKEEEEEQAGNEGEKNEQGEDLDGQFD